MKLVVISDTHGMHRDVCVPNGDIFIHAGDILGQGKLQELAEFNDWLGELPHTHKIIIAGNHDWCFQNSTNESRKILSNGIYLQDEFITLEGIKFYGSPWQPFFFNWAFNLNRGKELAEKWRLIPKDTDVLITHGPPAGFLDQVNSGDNVGCADLTEAVFKVNPKYHLFGHIHESYGKETIGDTTFVNACINTEKYEPLNPPIVLNYDA